MTVPRGPHNRGKCSFHADPKDVLSAEASIHKCVKCVQANNTQLESLTEDLRHIAFVTILEDTPKYDPNHPSGASFITFIKARVCTRLWTERRKALSHIPFPYSEVLDYTENQKHNPLVDHLIAEACTIENIADTVMRQLEVETLRKYLPKLLDKLSEKERSVLEMKFFEECSGVEIAETLDISEGRVSQLTQSALAKLGKAYLSTLERERGNPYRET